MLSRFSVKRPYTVIVGIVLVVILGIVSITRMPADLLPSMNLPYAVVMTTYPGASPEEVEEAVTKPLESSIATISNISNISSISSENMSIVICEYEQSANMDSVTIEMRENLDQIRTYWPDEISNPIIMKLNPDMLPIMIAAVDKEGLSRSELTNFVSNTILPEVESLEGVASVETTGNIEETIHVIIEQEKIDAVNKEIRAALDGTFADAEDELEKAQTELEQGKEELESGKEDMADQLSGAKKELTDTQLEVLKGEIEMNRQLEELKKQEGELLAGEKELEKQEAELNKAEEELNQTQQELESAKTQLTMAKEGLAQLLSGKANLEKAKAELESNLKEIKDLGEGAPEEIKNKIPELELQLSVVEEQLNQINQQIETIGMSEEEIDEKIAEVENGLIEVNKGKEELISGKEMLSSSKTELESGKEKLAGGIAALEGAKADIESGKTTISEALAEISKNEILASIEMSGASSQIASGERELESGIAELEQSKDNAYENASLDNIISSDMIKGILSAQNFNMPAGYVAEEGVDYLIRVGDKLPDKSSIEELILLDMEMEGLDPIRLSDVAEVVEMDNSKEVYSVVNGNPALMITIQKQTGYSTGEVAERINDKFDQLMEQDSTIHFLPLMDQGIYIDMTVNSVVNNMISGAILAIVILFLFLKDIKPTLVVACSIPVSIITAIALMYFSGITLNVISLSGLALGIGMLVDNSIVVVENIYRLRNEGMSARKAAVEGAKQVAGAIFASTLTTVSVFLPIVFTEGITRQLFVDMGLTIAYSLLASLLISLTFVPMMGAGMLKNTNEKKNKLVEGMKNSYGMLLEKSLKYKGFILIGSVVILVLSIWGATSRGTSFMPSMESTQATITLTTDEDATLEETGEISDEAMKRILEIEDVESIGAMAGGSGMMGLGGGSSNNSVTMYMILKEDKEHSGTELTELIMDMTSDLDCELSINTETMDMSAMGGSGIQIDIKGRELDQLQEIATEVKEIIENVDGTIDISDGQEESTPELRVVVDKEKASEYNLTVAQVFQEINKKLSEASRATTITIDSHDYDIYVKNKEDEELTRKDLELLTLSLKDQEGNNIEVSLSDIADFQDGTGPSSIQRNAQERYVSVSSGIASGHNIGLVGNEIQKQLDQYEIPEGYSIQIAGENEMIDDALSQVLLMLLLAVIFIYLIMVAQFQSLLSPFIIMFTIPLAFTGGFLGLFITNNEISVIAMIGFVLLAGVIVNNGIVLVDYINQLRRSGMEKKDAIVEAGITRIRPILMTALTTILGLSTLSAGFGMGADMIQPMAIVSIGGLIYGTLLTLFVVPSMYDLLNKNKSMVEEEI